MSSRVHTVIHEEMGSCLNSCGFDIAHPFSLDDLSESIQACLPLDDFSEKVGFLVGNTRVVWQHFIEWLAQQPNWSEIVDPFNTYVEQSIERCAGEDAMILWTHEVDKYIVPVQRMAHEAGLAYLSAGQMNIHPHFGPWFALRAVVIVSGHAPYNPSVENPSTKDVEIQVGSVFQRLVEQAGSWQEWLGLRDLYEVGKGYRYSEPQIEYHYTHDKMVLLEEIDKAKSESN